VNILNLRRMAGDKSAGALLERGIVRVDRETPWGNPFVVGRHGARAQVIARYRRQLWQRIRAGEIDLAELAALDGRDLACWCHPEPCHAAVLARAARWAAQRLEKSSLTA